MGQMINGRWFTDDGIRAQSDGAFKRAESRLRNHISPDPDAVFPAESGRYHLYVALNCPWAHRTLLMQTMKGLDDHIGLSVAAPARTDQGWVFSAEDGYEDGLFGARALHEIYARGAEDYTGRVTVPVLYDTLTDRIVSNESAEIVRMLNSAFGAFDNGTDFYPQGLRKQIEIWNERIHHKLNNGVYRAGFAERQDAYDVAVMDVFETLDAIEEQLGRTIYLTGDHLTEADIRLFPTLVRFDVGYYTSFKCNRNQLIDFPNLWRYARQIYNRPGIRETVFFDIYRRGYSTPSPKRNIHGIMPVGPDTDWSLPLET